MAKPLSADQLIAAFKKWGVKYREHDGWRTHNRAGHGDWGPVHGILIHHTGDDAPDSADERVLWNGRADLPGPLCSWAQTDAGVTVLIGNGRANHAGNGSAAVLDHVINENYAGNLTPGPDTVDGNARLYGQETMYSGGHKMTEAAYANTLRTFAAVCDAHGWTAKSIIGHKEWTRRKPDPGHVDMATLRRDVQALLNDGPNGKPAPKPKPVPKPTPEPKRPPVALELAGKTITKLPSLANARLMLDWSWAEPDLDKVAADPRVRGIARYLSHDPDKNISDAERAGIHKRGDWLLFVRQEGKTATDRQRRALQGHAAGVADAEDADALADKLGIPDHVVLFHPVDTDATFAEVRDYWKGVHSAARRDRGVYAGVRIVDAVVGAGLAKHGWQTTSWSTEAGRLRISKHARLLQLHGDWRKGAEVAGLDPNAYDSNLILAGPAVDVWHASQPKRKPKPAPKPTPAPDPTPPASGFGIESVVVLPKGSSDHNPVLTTFTLGGARFTSLQCNVQQTDAPSIAIEHLHSVSDQAETRPDVIVWNELGTLALQNAVRALPGYSSSHMYGSETANDSRNAVTISWDSARFRLVDEMLVKVHGGIAHITPTRVIRRVLLEDATTGVRFWRQGTHVVHHIEVSGKPRLVGAITGQNDRARKHFALLADDVIDAARTAPVLGSGDLNVDYLAEAKLKPSERDPGFPFTMLGAHAHIANPTHGTHGARLIDWGWYRNTTRTT